MHRALAISYVLCLFVQVYVGFVWPGGGPGFAAPTADGPLFCADLVSSGGDDDAMMIAFLLMLLSAAVRILRWGQSANRIELAVFWLSVALIVATLWLASLDCANVLYTAFTLGHPLLLAGLVALTGAAVLMTAARRSAQR
jgi:hypothetical protein